MAGLIDIAPRLPGTVTVNGTEVSVNGLSAHHIAELLAEFPKLRAAIDGVNVEAADLIRAGKDAVGMLLAAGTGAFGDKAAAEAGVALVVEDQVDILEAIIAQTLPRSKKIGPFLERLAEWGLMEAPGRASGAA